MVVRCYEYLMQGRRRWSSGSLADARPPWTTSTRVTSRARGLAPRSRRRASSNDWSPEHHFLKNYSHQPAPRCTSPGRGADKRIHVGTAIVNITAAVNHPARVAERIAVMDHLSRVGSIRHGRGSSSAEWAARHPVGGRDQAHVARVARGNPAHVARRALQLRGKTSHARAERAAQALLQAPPAHLGRLLEPAHLIEAGELGLGSLCFTFGTPAEIAENVPQLQGGDQALQAADRRVHNDNIAVTTNMFCLEDGDQARTSTPRPAWRPSRVLLRLARLHPAPEGLPREGPIKVPPEHAEYLKAGLALGGRQIGSPEEIVRVIEMYEAPFPA